MKINEKILADSEFIKRLELSELRLLKDGDVDWFILIPLRDELIEWCDLSHDEQVELTKEINLLSRELKDLGYDKINIGSLGNLVPQLHIHVIGRNKSDRAWPGPIWGTKALNEFDVSKVKLWKGKLSESGMDPLI